MSIRVGEYTATEGCEFSLADAKHDFHTIFKAEKITEYVNKNIPSYPQLQCSPLSEDAFVDKYALESNSDSGSNKNDKTFIQTHLNSNIKSRYEAFYIDRPQHKYNINQSLLQDHFRSVGLLDDIFFICDVAYANVREDLKFVNESLPQTFYWVQNSQTLYDPAGKTTWHSDKPYFEDENVDEEGNVIISSNSPSSSDLTGKITAPNHFKKKDSKFIFCWQNAKKSKITQYPKWSTDLFPSATTPYNYSTNIPELMLYTNKDLFLGIRANKENLDDYALQEAFLIITDPDKVGYYGYADKNLAAKGSGILNASELASYRAKGNELKRFVKFINESISSDGNTTKLFLDEVMNYSSIFQVLAKKVGDASQSISCCQKIINFQRFKDNALGPKASNNIIDFESNGNHAFVSFDRIAIVSALNFNAPIVIGNTQEGFTVFIQKELLNIHKQLDIFFTKQDDKYQILNQLKTTNEKSTFFTLDENLLNDINANKDLVKEAILKACLNLNITPVDDITYQLFLINYFNESNVLQIFSNISPDVLNYNISDYNKKIVKIYNDNLEKIKENNTFEIDFSDLIVIDESSNILEIMTNINNNVNKIIQKINTIYDKILNENNGNNSVEEYKNNYKYTDDTEKHKTYVNILELLKKVEKLIIDLSEYQKFLTLNNNSMIKIKEYQGLIKETNIFTSLNSENNKVNVGLLPKGIAKNITGYTPYSYYLSNDRTVRNSDIFIDRSTSIFGTTTSILQIFKILNSEGLSKIKDNFVQTIYNVLEEIAEKATANSNISFISVINTSKDLLKNLSILNPGIHVTEISENNISIFLPLLTSPASQEVVEPNIEHNIEPTSQDTQQLTTTSPVNSSSGIRDVLIGKKLLISTRSNNNISFKYRVELIRNSKDKIESLFKEIASDGEVEKTYLDQTIKIAYENEIFIKGFIGIFAFMSYTSIMSGIEAPALFTTREKENQKKVLQNLFSIMYLDLNDNKVDPNPLENLEQIRNSIQAELPGFNFDEYDKLTNEQDKNSYISNLEGIKTKKQKNKLVDDFNKYLNYCEEIKNALGLYQNIDQDSKEPSEDKSDFSLYSFRKLLEMNIVTVHDDNPLKGKFEGINANEINANLALLYYVENRMAKKSKKPIPHPELIGLFSQLFVGTGLYSQESMFRNNDGKKLGGGGDGLFEVMYDLFISDEDISSEDIPIPDVIKKYYKYKNKKITLFDIYRINSYLLLNMPTNLEIEANSFSFYPEEIRIYVTNLSKEFQREKQRQYQIANLGNLARGGPLTGRTVYDNQNLYKESGFQERGFLPTAIGVRGGMTKKHKKNKTKKNKTKKTGNRTNKNKTKKHKKNKIKVTKKYK